MRHGTKILLIGVFALLLNACASTSKKGETEQGQAATGQEQRGAAQAQGGFTGSPFEDPNNPLSKHTIYFDYDKSDIHPEDRDVIIAHAKYLVEHPNIKVVLEGHTDERGTREYNIALGERRAKAVSQLMQLQGVAKSQIDVVSFGEERPVALGHDESAWRLNRRVEITYPGM
ncbi:MAG: peptidoglycan-associated lipoprotein Pal [Gammaproteobacteria bacterium]|nr:peptidoglycan-associated lipoprotein Pal [Gammaproteobacteria bacterium]